jgi:hypothetical protein
VLQAFVPALDYLFDHGFEKKQQTYLEEYPLSNCHAWLFDMSNNRLDKQTLEKNCVLDL